MSSHCKPVLSVWTKLKYIYIWSELGMYMKFRSFDFENKMLSSTVVLRWGGKKNLTGDFYAVSNCAHRCAPALIPKLVWHKVDCNLFRILIRNPQAKSNMRIQNIGQDDKPENIWYLTSLPALSFWSFVDGSWVLVVECLQMKWFEVSAVEQHLQVINTKQYYACDQQR